jgi:hypothetical protein
VNALSRTLKKGRDGEETGCLRRQRANPDALLLITDNIINFQDLSESDSGEDSEDAEEADDAGSINRNI